MTCDVAVIAEGKGETAAVPVLLRRIAGVVAPGLSLKVTVFRQGRQQVVKNPNFEQIIDLAARRIGQTGLLLVLLDADTDCPAQLGPELVERAMRTRPDRTARVVLAKTEYEAWFVAAAESIAGKRGFRADMVAPEDPEAIRDAKGWLMRHMVSGRTYRPSADQASLTATFDMSAARSAPSFDKLWRDVVAELRLRYDRSPNV